LRPDRFWRIIYDMTKPRREPITDDQLQGFKYFRKA
jgi:hypothetical protein